jgi:hypothetical protein
MLYNEINLMEQKGVQPFLLEITHAIDDQTECPTWIDFSDPNCLLAWHNLRFLISQEGKENETKKDISLLFPASYYIVVLCLSTFYFYPKLLDKFFGETTFGSVISVLIDNRSFVADCLVDVCYLTICFLSRIYYVSLYNKVSSE